MAFKGTPGTIADAFQSSFRQVKEQKQRQREFSQELAEKQRQGDLLNTWRMQNLQESIRANKALEADRREDNARIAEDNKIKNDLARDRYESNKYFNEERIKQSKAYNKFRMSKPTDATPSVSPGDYSKGFTSLGDAWTKYQKYRGSVWDPDSKKFKFLEDDGQKNVNLDRTALNQLKKESFGSVINRSNALVKQINANYPGFERIFNLAFQNIKNPDEINSWVESTEMPTDAKRWMKEILAKRIFGSSKTDLSMIKAH